MQKWVPNPLKIMALGAKCQILVCEIDTGIRYWKSTQEIGTKNRYSEPGNEYLEAGPAIEEPVSGGRCGIWPGSPGRRLLKYNNRLALTCPLNGQMVKLIGCSRGTDRKRRFVRLFAQVTGSSNMIK